MNNLTKQSTKSFYKTLNPCRHQIEFKECCLDDSLPPYHKARKIWEFVKNLESDSCFRKIKSMAHAVGRPTTSPDVLLCLWLYALTEGISSGRKIADLSKYHDAYRWISGGVPINRTMLCEFRVLDSALFQQLLTNSLAMMLRANLLIPEDLAQDGSKLQASAGGNTYRGEATLTALLAEANNYVKKVGALSSQELKEIGAQKVGARKRAAREQEERIKDAQRELKKHQEDIKNNKSCRSKKEVQKRLKNSRASYGDPTVRRMKMGDGGFRLAYNVQFVTGTKSRAIFGVDITNSLDPGTLTPMMAQVNTRLEKIKFPFPENWLADSAYSSAKDVTESAALFPNCRLIAPTPMKDTELAKKPKSVDSKATYGA